MKHLRIAPAVGALLALAACNSDRTTEPLVADRAAASLSSDASNDSDNGSENSAGVVFTLSNQVAGNAVLAFHRGADGSLTADGSYPTGGAGSGAGLGSQNAVVYSPDGKLLFAVNAGSNTVTAFRVHDDKLTLASTIASGGTHPISVTAARGLLYVLNDGGRGNIAGLRYASNGTLSSIAGSSRSLSTAAAGPAEVQFTSKGDRLIVSEKNTNTLGAYSVDDDGLASAGLFTASAGVTPFGFVTRDDEIIISEAAGGAANASSASSYEVGRTGPLSVITASAATTETSACWVAVTGNGRYAYTANTSSGTISGFAVSKGGALTRLDANGETAVFGAGTAPADLAVSHNSQFLYSRNGGARTIGVARIHGDGSLTVLAGGVSGLPSGTVGLAAR
jgi:6-phosphogluconolactonase